MKGNICGYNVSCNVIFRLSLGVVVLGVGDCPRYVRTPHTAIPVHVPFTNKTNWPARQLRVLDDLSSDFAMLATHTAYRLTRQESDTGLHVMYIHYDAVLYVR